MTTKVAINGFGRIGKNVLRVIFERNIEDLEVVVINNSKDVKTHAHLLKYDSCFGKFDGQVEVGEDKLIVNGKEIHVTGERDLDNLDWRKYDVDIVIEGTGKYRDRESAMKHIKAGAKKVIITAPAKEEDITIVLGVNDELYDPDNHSIISNASCTTNCLAPFTKVINDNFGIKKGFMTTIHSYTKDQRILDGTHSDLRRARAAAESIIPTSTGAAKAVGKVIPSLNGLINGNSMRVPTMTVSVVDTVFELENSTSIEEVNNVLKEASENSMEGILGYSDEPLVSVDYRKDPRSSIIDGLSTMMIGDKMVKLVSWYDNEWGYCNRIVDLTSFVAKSLK